MALSDRSLFCPFNDPKIAHCAFAKCLQSFRVCRTIVGSSSLFQARVFDNDRTLFNALFAGDYGVAPSKEASPKR